MSNTAKIVAAIIGVILVGSLTSKILGGMTIRNPTMPNIYAPNYQKTFEDTYFLRILEKDIEETFNNVIILKAERAKKINSFKLDAVDGGTIDSSTFAGKVTLVYVFGAFSDVSIKELPHIGALLKKYGNAPFAAYGIVARSNRQEMDELIKKEKPPMRIALVEGKSPVPITFIPANLFLDKNGLVRAYIYGELEAGLREHIIDKLLKE